MLKIGTILLHFLHFINNFLSKPGLVSPLYFLFHMFQKEPMGISDRIYYGPL